MKRSNLTSSKTTWVSWKKNQLLTHMCGATLLAVHATHHVGAVFDGLKKWKSWPTVKQSELVGQLRAWVVWKVPCLPVIPWQMTLVSLLIHTWRCLEKNRASDVGSSQICFLESFQEFWKKRRCNLHHLSVPPPWQSRSGARRPPTAWRTKREFLKNLPVSTDVILGVLTYHIYIYMYKYIYVNWSIPKRKRKLKNLKLSIFFTYTPGISDTVIPF